jgi:tetratricopeptide (TPR) repeat protein
VDIARRLRSDSADAISLFALELDNAQLRIQAWERALELDPDHAISYYRYAVQLKENGKLDEAERLLKRAIRFNPGSERFHQELEVITGLRKIAQTSYE